MPPKKKFYTSVKRLFKKDRVLTHMQISKMLKKDKAKVSGYLEAMVDYGELVMKKFGNSKAYLLNDREKK